MEDVKNTETTESSMVDSNKETTETNVATEPTKEKTFTQEELEKIISKRLDRERKKAEEEKAEAERLAQMSAEERAKDEFNKEKAKFEDERKTFLKQQLELQVVKELTTKNLPLEFSNYLIADTAESCMENIKVFESTFSNAVEKAVQERLKGGYQPPSNKTNTNVIKKEDFNKMTYKERFALKQDNPTLYEELVK